MSTQTLLLSSLRHYWRTHLGVVLGTALGAMVLVGALLVGDSVNATLRRQAAQRVGKVQSALLGGDHFFREALGDAVGAVPMLMLRGSVSQADNSGRANQVQVLGVTSKFWEMAPGDAHVPLLAGARAAVNERLARQLNLRGGSTLIVRLEKPSAFSKDAPLSGPESQTVALRVEVVTEVPATAFGNFSLQANQVPPFTIFLPLDFLQERLGLKEKANVLLSAQWTAIELHNAVAVSRTIDDVELEVRKLKDPSASDPNGAGVELRTNRVFLDPVVVSAAAPGLSSLTYLVNELRAGNQMAPYSMATALGPGSTILPEEMRDDQVVINQWLADDLNAKVGSTVTLKYFVMGERRKLDEQSHDFTVAAILPMETPQLDSSWMPDFPGLSDKKNCRDWEPGFAMDNSKIRPKDEQYWTKFRGTPKVFVTLQAGRQMWGNRWGNTTSIRYFPASETNSSVRARAHGQEALYLGKDNIPRMGSELLLRLSPEKTGMNFVPLREQAQAATEMPVNFGELFLYFSFFLLIAAAVLTGLLFVFSLEQRNEEAGLLLGVGWPAAKVRRLLLGEGAVLAVAGSLLGALGGLIYTWAVLRALATVWRTAVGAVDFEFSAQPQTVLIGLVSAVFVALFSMWLASRRQLRQTVHSLLIASGEATDSHSAGAPARSWSTKIAVGCLVAALGMLAFAFKAGPPIFFGAGALLLIAGIAYALSRLRRTAGQGGALTSLDGLGVRNAARRRGRSVATIAVLASGVFMVVAVDAFRQKGGADLSDRKSGTGGFALLGESASPLYEDLNIAAGRESYGLGAMPNVHFVPMRVREGDDASCLNLNRALQPRLLGVKPADLATLHAFKLSDPKGWTLLDSPADEQTEAIPGVVDGNTLQWALKMKLGDVVTYLDERGQAFKVRLAGTVAGSILQGSVLISEQHFIAKFPNQGGYRYFLIDAPADRMKAVAEELSRGLADYGFEVTSPAQRLTELQAVENTYLAIFQALGGLGLLLGSAGLAIVVARNVLERRREFGLLEAVGFRPAQMRALVFAEHRWLIVAGLIVGVGSAIVAVFPSLRDQARGFPFMEMGILLWALVAGSFFWIWLATRLSLRGERISALRTE